MNTLKVGIIGAGFIGKQHIEAIRRIPGTEVVAVADSNEEMAHTVSKQMAVPRWYSSYEKLLLDKEIKVIHNCTPNASHYPINKAAIIEGKHIYCEKPLTLTAIEAKELVNLAAEKKVATGVNFNYRHNVMVKEMRERAKASLGKTFTVYGEYLQDWLMYDTDYDWRINPAFGGASRAIADIGSHCFDTAQYILNQQIVSVYAQLINVFPQRKRCAATGETFSGRKGAVEEIINVGTEDAAFIMVKFADGTPGLFHVSQITGGRKNGLAVTISGSEYSMEWSQEQADRLLIGNRNTANEELYADARLLTSAASKFAGLPGGHAVAWHDALKNAIGVFYDSIRDGSYKGQDALDYVDFAGGCYIMRLVDACLASHRNGCWVDVEEDKQ